MDAVVAVYRDWGIGLMGTQPVVVPEDRKHFRELTRGSTVILGRRTLADFPGGRPLPKRRNIVLTRGADFSVPGAEAARSVEEALSLVRGDARVFVIGGASVYRQLLPYCERVYATAIDACPVSDAFFPNLDELPEWELEYPGEELIHETPEGDIRYRFMVYRNNAICV